MTWARSAVRTPSLLIRSHSTSALEHDPAGQTRPQTFMEVLVRARSLLYLSAVLTCRLQGRLTVSSQLLLSWSRPVRSSSGYRSMSLISASFWHGLARGAPPTEAFDPGCLGGLAGGRQPGERVELCVRDVTESQLTAAVRLLIASAPALRHDLAWAGDCQHPPGLSGPRNSPRPTPGHAARPHRVARSGLFRTTARPV